jgi:hypothetical protein
MSIRRVLSVSALHASLVFAMGASMLAENAAQAAPPKAAAPKPTAPSASSTGGATPAPVPTLAESLTGDAKTDYEAAKIYFNDKDYGRAYLKFQSAYDRSKDGRLLWNMAACQKEQRKYGKVVPLVEQYIKERGDKLTPQEKESAEALLAAIRPGVTTVKVDVSEPEAEIYLDGELIGKSPMTVGVLTDLGPHKLAVKKASFDDFEQPLNAGADSVTVLVKMSKTVHEGRVLVKAGKDDAISIDGQVVGQGTYSAKLPSGSHVLRVSSPGMRPYQGDVVVVDNETREIPIALDRAETKVVVPTWIWYAGAGLVVAGGVVAGYLIIDGNSKTNHVYNGPSGSLGNVELSRPIPGFRF